MLHRVLQHTIDEAVKSGVKVASSGGRGVGMCFVGILVTPLGLSGHHLRQGGGGLAGETKIGTTRGF